MQETALRVKSIHERTGDVYGSRPMVRELQVQAREIGRRQARSLMRARSRCVEGAVSAPPPTAVIASQWPSSYRLRWYGIALTGGGLEHPVDNATVVMDVTVEADAEAVQEAHRVETRAPACAAGLAQMRLDDAQAGVHHRANGLRLALWVQPQAPRHRYGPFTDGPWHEDVIHQMGVGLRYPLAVVTDSAPR